MTMDTLFYRAGKFLNELLSVVTSGFAMLAFIAVQAFVFFVPVKFNIYFVGALIIADVFTSLAALFMQSKRDCPTLRCAFLDFYTKWTSKRAFDSIPKFIWYSILVLLAYMVGYIFEEPMKVAKLSTGIIAYVEIRSIIENGDKAFGTNLWELVVDGLQKFFKLK